MRVVLRVVACTSVFLAPALSAGPFTQRVRDAFGSCGTSSSSNSSCTQSQDPFARAIKLSGDLATASATSSLMSDAAHDLQILLSKSGPVSQRGQQQRGQQQRGQQQRGQQQRGQQQRGQQQRGQQQPGQQRFDEIQEVDPIQVAYDSVVDAYLDMEGATRFSQDPADSCSTVATVYGKLKAEMERLGYISNVPATLED